ncbi:tetraacyldisaccharide 4'-kinase [soil metagenome]
MEDFYRRVISGQQRGLAAMSLRALAAVVEPIYRSIVRRRNARFDRGAAPIHRAGRPVICVGNITTGGTGKTPVVRWLAESLRSRGVQPAILLRGYRSPAGEPGDEQTLLRSQLGDVVVHANPDRVAGAGDVLREHAEVNALILDDGFQHRRLHRDFDLVLIDATNPFGYGRLLPRGLLREPIDALHRADAILITRADQSSSLNHLESTLRAAAPGKPIFRSAHQQTDLAGRDGLLPISQLAGKPVIALSGIGNPESFERQLQSAGARIVTSKRFGDHHHYAGGELAELTNISADAIVTTEKDWIKLARLIPQNFPIPFWRARISVRFDSGQDQQLLEKILATITTPG